MPRDFVTGIQLGNFHGIHLGDIQIGLTGKTAHVGMSQQTRTQIKGTLDAPLTQKRRKAAILHNAVIIAEGTGLAFSAWEHQGVKPFSHISTPL